MRSQIEYLSVADVIAVYREMMREMGSRPTELVREGALESAVHRPRALAHYAGASLIEQAVALGTGIALAYPWVDGNKRGAFRSMMLFLHVNGVVPPTPKPERYQALAELLERFVAAQDEERTIVEQHVTDELDQWVAADAPPDQAR
jgi:death on curing protein